MKTWTVEKIRKSKGNTKLACLTAYDYACAKLADAAGIPLLLVGDSLGMAVLGFKSTLPVTLEMSLHHTAAVARAAENSLVVTDMPFLSYQISIEEAIRNCGRALQEAGADAVKIEGGAFRAPLVKALTQNGIPVLGHIGLTPQSVNQLGGYRIQGKTTAAQEQLLADAKALQEAGVFALVIESVPPVLAKQLTASVTIPVIGIGAGPDCDGQILVMHDLLGFCGDVHPKFVKVYAHVADDMKRAFEAYAGEVKSGAFPAKENCY